MVCEQYQRAAAASEDGSTIPVHISVVHGELGTRQIAYSEVISVEVDTDIAYWNAAFGETSKTLASSNNVPQ